MSKNPWTDESPVTRQNVLSRLHAMLESHDWWFEYSDDHRVWSRGVAARDKIDATCKKAIEFGLGAKAMRLWLDLSPHGPQMLEMFDTERPFAAPQPFFDVESK